MMKTVAILLLVCVIGALGVVVPTSRDLDEDWKLWKSMHGKNYGSYSAELERRLIWEDNLKFILKHNLEESLGKTSFLLKMNQFGDLTNAEFVATRTGLKQGQPPVALKPSSFTRSPGGIPDQIDWRDQGYVTPVKDQGQCGSCWAFSAVASLEGQLFAKSGKLVSLSEQNLVDCSTAEGDAGCAGGWPVWAYTYIEKNNGIDTEAGYPYRAVEGACQYNPSYVGTSITGFTPLPPSEEALEQSLATIGPISVCIDAAHQSFQFYSTGVYYEPDCSSEELDHCVTAVGYGYTENNAKYYIVKNSWGTSWGQEGYIWMARDYNNQCGIATNASYPLL